MAIVIHNLRSAPITHLSAVHRRSFATSLSSPRRFNVRANLLPFPEKSSKYYKHLEAAVEVVQRASSLCVDVKSSLFSTDDKVLEKNDNTPVTVADFGVQALLSLELNKLFPDIPLVAEEDSAFVRSRNLAGTVLDAVTTKASSTSKPLTQDDVLKAIDRGGKDAFVFGSKPATYWVLDPIDGTRGFLKASKALYVVGLALVVEGEVVIGVMGCPNWQEDLSEKNPAEMKEHTDSLSGSGIVMIAHIGFGTWTKRLNSTSNLPDVWTRCFVDGFDLVHKARLCLPDSQTWESLPLSSLFNATSDADNVVNNQILVLTACCGSLSKYLMVASGRASIFIQRKKEKTIKSWDHAVGMLCVHEAGGKVSDWEGSEIDLAADESGRRLIFPSGGVLVTNGNLHHKILQIISQTSTV
ncbi:PREDICTED: putative PAP-specific phosphatase, mitochondrial isoform X2 [Lupinus angustifolius]|uniref:putative PAP-specific phosphatase, mitochondrial isoform X2 n=1 Tax=Lupinus angustifolius TaxID=3871 RepID=UPI00092EB458|nr:PREDICTED: putative PAP-specific phosphatase, mitochondrial isoform X2 [Lupinus angustifolius]